jgi:transcription-repair coupling factor (superfamily II helicase)
MGRCRMIEKLMQEFKALPEYLQLLESIKAGVSNASLGLPRAARLFLLATLRSDIRQPILLITDRADRAIKLMDELRFWLPDVDIQGIPEPTPSFYEQAPWGAVVRRERLQALTKVSAAYMPGRTSKADPSVFVASIRAIMTRSLPRRDFIKSSRWIKVSDKTSPESLQRNWVEIGYHSADIVVEPGQFSRRGGILDIWPPVENFPVRMDFFGDEIESIRRFDPSSQRTLEVLEQVLVTPAMEILPGKAVGLDFEGQELNEFYLPLIHPTPATVLDYLVRDSLVLFDGMDNLQLAADEIEEQAVQFRKDSIDEGLLSEQFPEPYTSWSEIQDNLYSFTTLDLGYTMDEQQEPVAEIFSPGPRFGGRLKAFKEYLIDLCVHNQQVWIVSRQISRLKELWEESIAYQEVTSSPTFLEGSLSEGWVLTLDENINIHFLTDSEIFGWERPQPRRRLKYIVEAPEANYSDLRPGDWVVHIDYGIGRYSGLVKRTVDGVEREFLMVEYDGGDQLYVPVHQADRLSRYIGPSGEPPTPTRLGTAEWSRAKGRVREAVEEIAKDLLELYARRQIAEGFAFSLDSAWQKDLEEAFPYVETADQVRAINEVKKDMEAPRPMDRLLCGDVGYGKTEVALRAAFKAVMDGKQVAILVPTTVLAQQHYETFRQRLAPFPVNVEMLSRFRTQKQQDEILKQLRKGSIDIVIGTHRLIQADVAFQNLGLVIIDEEQRFGVTHKEHLKKLRTEVDVLTMTATPIPRTLYMALTGVRDISTINTPPEERLPIITHIGPYSPHMVRQAILRELERGGQIFFVHNRVRTIRAMERHLQQLVPEARIGVGHGQMPEKELEEVMMDFSKGKIDVLLCTSIIESGLDIPNANTLIVDRGDTFGLAQLYQLRGRVGRSAQRAHAYFFRHRTKAPTAEGLERLETIAEYTQLGAGYSIAMRDLEMRGAGELLGTQQHGYIASVGFHLYTQLLARAVRELKRVHNHTISLDFGKAFSQKEITIPVNVDLPLPVGIPMNYIADQNLRLQLYRRLANLQTVEELKKIEEEFTDRFGPIPDEINNLFYQLKVKLLAEQCGLTSITVEGEQIVLRFPPLPDGVESRDLPNVGYGARIGKNAYRLMMEDGDWQQQLLSVLQAIYEYSFSKDLVA